MSAVHQRQKREETPHVLTGNCKAEYCYFKEKCRRVLLIFKRRCHLEKKCYWYQNKCKNVCDRVLPLQQGCQSFQTTMAPLPCNKQHSTYPPVLPYVTLTLRDYHPLPLGGRQPSRPSARGGGGGGGGTKLSHADEFVDEVLQ